MEELNFALYNSYCSLAAANESLEIAKKALDNAKENLNNTEKRFNAGLVSSLDLMNARLSLSRTQSSYVSIKSTRDSAYASLKNILGVDYDFDIKEIDEPVFIILPDADEIYYKYLDSNLVVKSLRLNHDLLKVTAQEVILSNSLPSISASLEYQYGDSTSKNDKINQLGLSVNMSLPLDSFIPSTAAYNQIKNSTDRLKIAKLNLENGFKTYREKLQSRIDEISNLKAVCNQAEAHLELAEEGYKLTKDAFEKGTADMNSLSTSLEMLLSAEVALVSAGLDYKRAVYAFAMFLGVDFEKFVSIYKSS